MMVITRPSLPVCWSDIICRTLATLNVSHVWLVLASIPIPTRFWVPVLLSLEYWLCSYLNVLIDSVSSSNACIFPRNLSASWLDFTSADTVHSCISLWIKPKYELNSSFIDISTLHVSDSLSAHHQEFLAVHRLWYILCSCDDCLLPEVGWHCVLLLIPVAYGHHNCIKCTKADVRLTTPDDGQIGCPKHVESKYR
jgi:hypothetical protein